MDIASRKLRHIEACLDPRAQYSRTTTGLEQVPWEYNALPEQSLEHIDLTCTFLGHELKAPLFIGAMTGGAAQAKTINRNLAIAAQHLGIGMMLGSQRIMLENPKAIDSFKVRDVAPSILLVGNLGAGQLVKGYNATHVQRACELVGANALAIHLNPLQEAMQPQGDTDYTAVIQCLNEVVTASPYPIVLKEVGHGISGAVAQRIAHIPFAAIDVAGAGGTSWAKVEDLVHNGTITQPELGELGLPTAQALQQVHRVLPHMPLIGSGGVRSGLDVAKSLKLGAVVCAMAQPLLKPALHSPEAVIEVLEQVLWQLKVALFVSGVESVKHLLPAK